MNLLNSFFQSCRSTNDVVWEVQRPNSGVFALAVDAVCGGVGRAQKHKNRALIAIDAVVVIDAGLG